MHLIVVLAQEYPFRTKKGKLAPVYYQHTGGCEQYTGQNQSKAAVYLGLSRGTLRKKLERYGMLICGSSRNNES